MHASQVNPAARAARWPLLLAIFLCGLAPAAAGTPDPVAQEYAVKAAFLLNFAKFVGWPAAQREEGEPTTIGVLGRDPYGATLDALVTTRNSGGDHYRVQRHQDVKDLAPCHILFVRATNEEQERGILRSLAGQPVLTVGDTETFALSGGIIRFYVEHQRVRFEINEQAAKQAGLTISSKLLRLQKKPGR